MRIIGDEIDAVCEHGCPAAGALGCIARDPTRCGARSRIAPYLTAGACIERIDLVGTGDVHDAVDHQRCRFQSVVGQGMNPFRAKLRHVSYVDAIEQTVAVAIDVAGIGRPIARFRSIDRNGGGRRGDGVPSLTRAFGHAMKAAQVRDQVTPLFGCAAERRRGDRLDRNDVAVFRFDQRQ